MRRLVFGVALVAGIVAGAPAFGETPAAPWLYAVLPMTPDTAREVVGLLRAPERVATDIVDATGAVLEAAPAVPGALVHDLLDTPFRHLHLLHALVTDVVELGELTTGTRPRLLSHTVRALYRSAVFSTAAGLFRRVTHRDNRTVRLAIVVTARANGLPLDASDLDLVSRAIDRDAPDLAPLLARTIDRLIAVYGRDAIRILLTG